MKSKKIIIDSQGPINPLGGAYGPVLTPFIAPMSTINALVAFKYNVFEVLESGKKVKLTYDNLNLDNNAQAATDKEATKAPQAPKPDKGLEEADLNPDTTEAPKDENKQNPQKNGKNNNAPVGEKINKK